MNDTGRNKLDVKERRKTGKNGDENIEVYVNSVEFPRRIAPVKIIKANAPRALNRAVCLLR
jgi:hypothetical protein